MKNPRVLAPPLMTAAIVADQVTKWLVVHSPALAGAHASVPVLPFFSLVHWRNKGVSFGLFNALKTPAMQEGILVVLTFLILLVLAVSLGRTRKALPAAGLGLVMGGAIGNLIDRLHYGAVTDFLYFHYGRYDFPAFNVGDSCVTIGVGLLLLDGLGLGRDKSASFRNS